jgi:DNA-binding transcriptional LysR family regulator
VELRQLQAFEAVATDLHFGRAAKRLFTSQPALSEQIRRLERELGTPLFHRTSRRVELTPAGTELLARARVILAQVDDAAAAVRRFRDGAFGSVRFGVTPPVTPVLAPHLVAVLAETSPGIAVDLVQMWLPDLHSALVEGNIDVAVTPGAAQPPRGVQIHPLGREPLLVGLRPSHRFANRSYVALDDLNGDVLGQTSEALFPAWVQAQQAVLKAAGMCPPTAALWAADLSATRWADQPEVDWVLVTPSLAAPHQTTTFVSLSPPEYIVFSLLWPRDHEHDPSLARFLKSTLAAELPTGWVKPVHADNPSRYPT